MGSSYEYVQVQVGSKAPASLATVREQLSAVAAAASQAESSYDRPADRRYVLHAGTGWVSVHAVDTGAEAAAAADRARKAMAMALAAGEGDRNAWVAARTSDSVVERTAIELSEGKGLAIAVSVADSDELSIKVYRGGKLILSHDLESEPAPRPWDPAEKKLWASIVKQPPALARIEKAMTKPRTRVEETLKEIGDALGWAKASLQATYEDAEGVTKGAERVAFSADPQASVVDVKGASTVHVPQKGALELRFGITNRRAATQAVRLVLFGPAIDEDIFQPKDVELRWPSGVSRSVAVKAIKNGGHRLYECERLAVMLRRPTPMAGKDRQDVVELRVRGKLRTQAEHELWVAAIPTEPRGMPDARSTRLTSTDPALTRLDDAADEPTPTPGKKRAAPARRPSRGSVDDDGGADLDDE
jgi:hypothetical protein